MGHKGDDAREGRGERVIDRCKDLAAGEHPSGAALRDEDAPRRQLWLHHVPVEVLRVQLLPRPCMHTACQHMCTGGVCSHQTAGKLSRDAHCLNGHCPLPPTPELHPGQVRKTSQGSAHLVAGAAEHRVCEVAYDDVKGAWIGLQLSTRIIDDQLQPRVRERGLVGFQVPLAELAHHLRSK